MWAAMAPMLMSGLSSGIGSWLNSRNFVNPADKAMPYLDQISGNVHNYMDPYFNAGVGALGNLQGQYAQLLSDPGALMNKFGAGFKQSPGYQWNVGQATDAANRAAQAGGMVGSPQEQQQLSSTISGLANQDYYNYLSKVLGLYGQGLSGEQGLAGMGLQAGTTASDELMRQLMAQSQLAYAGQVAENENRGGSGGGFLGGFLGGLGGLGGIGGSNIF